MRRFDLAARQEPLADRLKSYGPEQTFDSLKGDVILKLIDWAIMDTHANKVADKHDVAEQILRDGGSKWKVGTRNGVPGLETRVPQGVQDTADAVMSSSASAGSILSEAWHAAYGINPDTEDAYEKAIKAVEEAGAHVVSPLNTKTTLGTMLRDMNTQKDWKLDLPTTDADVPVKMAEALWVGQESRHGGNGYRKPTQAEAEAAVLLAVPLVQLGCSGTEAIAQSKVLALADLRGRELAVELAKDPAESGAIVVRLLLVKQLDQDLSKFLDLVTLLREQDQTVQFEVHGVVGVHNLARGRQVAFEFAFKSTSTATPDLQRLLGEALDDWRKTGVVNAPVFRDSAAFA